MELGLVLVTTLLAATTTTAASPPNLTPDQKALVAKAERHDKNGWIYLHIEGAPWDRGFQHGFLLAPQIAENLRITRALWRHDSALDWDWLVSRSKTFLDTNVDAEYVGEIDGIVAGMQAAGVASSRSEIIAYNAWFELDWSWWPKEKKKMGSEAPHPMKQSCSSFIATGSFTSDHGVVLGHNSMVDYPEAYFNLVLDIQPQQGHRILMQSAPGLIHSGTDFFVTDAGLVGSETTIGNFDSYDDGGIPEFVRMRKATQYASNIDEWCDIMKRGNNGGYANAWLLGNVNSGEIARLELGLKYTNLEKNTDGYFLGSNIAEDMKILRFETDANENDVRVSAIARRVRWKKLMAQNAGKIDLPMSKRLEADHFDSFLEKDHAGSRSLCGHYEMEGQYWGSWPGGPYYPAGTFDGKVVDTAMAKKMSFSARWGSACGKAFNADAFLSAHPQFDWMTGILKSRPSEPWTDFAADEKR